LGYYSTINRPRSPKSGTRNRGLCWNWRVFCPENKRSPKKSLRQIWSIFLAGKLRFFKEKGLCRILERCLVPNRAHDTGLRKGGKSCPGEAKISPGLFPHLWFFLLCLMVIYFGWSKNLSCNLMFSPILNSVPKYYVIKYKHTYKHEFLISCHN